MSKFSNIRAKKKSDFTVAELKAIENAKLKIDTRLTDPFSSYKYHAGGLGFKVDESLLPLEHRSGRFSSKHDFEICLLELGRQLESLSSEFGISYYWKTKAVFDLRLDLVLYSLFMDLNIKELWEDASSGFLIIKPSLSNSLFFEGLAIQLYLAPEVQVRYILDFHFSHIEFDSKDDKKNLTTQQKRAQWLLQLLRLTVVELKTNQETYKISSATILAVNEWIEAEYLKLDQKGLHTFHKLPKPHKTSSNFLDHGSTEFLVTAYFKMLLKQNEKPRFKKEPYVSQGKLNYILQKWFNIDLGVGDPNGACTITGKELAWFIHEFWNFRTEPQGTGSTKEAFAERAKEDFPELFRRQKASSIASSMTAILDKHRPDTINWKHDDFLKDHKIP